MNIILMVAIGAGLLCCIIIFFLYAKGDRGVAFEGELPRAEVKPVELEKKQDVMNKETSRNMTRVVLGGKGAKTQKDDEEEEENEEPKGERELYRPIHFNMDAKLEEERISKEETIHLKAYEPRVYERKVNEPSEKKLPTVKERLSGFKPQE